jgi:hypothetical protein
VRVVPHDSAARRPLPERATEPALVVEEYSGVDLVPLSGRTNRSLWLAITFGIAIVGFGFAGHIWAPPPVVAESVDSSALPPTGQGLGPNPSPAVALTGLNPAEISPSDGGVVSVLDVSSTTVAGSTTVTLRRSAGSSRSEGDVRLLVDGSAPSDVDSVTIEIRAASGSLLASTFVPSVRDERLGLGGRPRVGIGSLRGQLVVPGPIPPDGWQVTISWRDGSNGSLGSVVQRIPTVNVGRI